MKKKIPKCLLAVPSLKPTFGRRDKHSMPGKRKPSNPSPPVKRAKSDTDPARSQSTPVSVAICGKCQKQLPEGEDPRLIPHSSEPILIEACAICALFAISAPVQS